MMERHIDESLLLDLIETGTLKYNEPILRDISYGWNVNVGITARSIGQITILEAKTAGLLPINLPKEIIHLTKMGACK